jgi:pilus assembly protein CpaC
MIVTTSQYVAFPQAIVTATNNNPSVLQVQPTQKNEVLISALATGVTQIDARGIDDTIYNVQVVVIGDARELQSILAQHFPTATLHIQPIRDAVIISGQVTSDEHVEQVVTIAEEFYQRVINKIEVIGVHTVMLQTQVMEVSRTKLRELGIDWSMGFGDDFVTTSAAGLVAPGATTGALLSAGNETFKFGIVDSGNQFFGLVRALRQNNLAKVLADPTVVAIDGRPASFNSGGEFPIIVPAGLGQVAIEFR